MKSGSVAPERKTQLAVLVLAALLVGLPLLSGRVLAGQDIVTYLINAQQTAANFAEGLFFPAWGGGFNAGYGSPALIFYPPLTSYLDAVPILLGVPVVIGVWVLALFAHLLSGVAMHGWLRSAGFEKSALPASVVYMVAPYRFVDLYLRSALSEHWAFVWPPLILWVASSHRLDRKLQVALTAILVAALVLTNIPMAALFGIALGFWFLSSRKLVGRRPAILSGVGLGFAVAAFALLPQALSSTYLNTDRYYGAAAGNFRASANTLFSGGFGVWNLNTVFSLALVLTGLLAVVAYGALGRSGRRDRGASLAALGAVVGVVVTSSPMGPIWDVLPVLSKLQFPWRVSAVITLLLAVLVARLEARRAWVLVALTVLVAAPFSSWGRTVPASAFIPPRPAQTAAGTVFPDPFAAWQAGSGGWYWRHEKLAEPWLLPKDQSPSLLAELSGAEPAEFDVIRQRSAVVREDPGAELRVLTWGQVDRELEIDSPSGGTLVWRAVAFPGMTVTVDGLPVAVSTDPTTGLLTSFQPAGRHRAHWQWRPFSALVWARWVTVFSIVIVVVLGLAGSLRVRNGRLGTPQ